MNLLNFMAAAIIGWAGGVKIEDCNPECTIKGNIVIPRAEYLTQAMNGGEPVPNAFNLNQLMKAEITGEYTLHSLTSITFADSGSPAVAYSVPNPSDSWDINVDRSLYTSSGLTKLRWTLSIEDEEGNVHAKEIVTDSYECKAEPTISLVQPTMYTKDSDPDVITIYVYPGFPGGFVEGVAGWFSYEPQNAPCYSTWGVKTLLDTTDQSASKSPAMRLIGNCHPFFPSLNDPGCSNKLEVQAPGDSPLYTETAEIKIFPLTMSKTAKKIVKLISQPCNSDPTQSFRLEEVYPTYSKDYKVLKDTPNAEFHYSNQWKVLHPFCQTVSTYEMIEISNVTAFTAIGDCKQISCAFTIDTTKAQLLTFKMKVILIMNDGSEVPDSSLYISSQFKINIGFGIQGRLHYLNTSEVLMEYFAAEDGTVTLKTAERVELYRNFLDKRVYVLQRMHWINDGGADEFRHETQLIVTLEIFDSKPLSYLTIGALVPDTIWSFLNATIADPFWEAAVDNSTFAVFNTYNMLVYSNEVLVSNTLFTDFYADLLNITFLCGFDENVTITEPYLNFTRQFNESITYLNGTDIRDWTVQAQLPLPMYVSNSEFCPMTPNISLYNETIGQFSQNLSWVYIKKQSDSSLLLEFNASEVLNGTGFSLHGFSEGYNISGQPNTTLHLNFSINLTHTIVYPPNVTINEPPYFSDSLPSAISIDLNDFSDSFFSYASPLAVDPEDGELSYAFSDFSDLQYIQVKKSVSNSSFTIKINKDLAKAQGADGELSLEITLSDDNRGQIEESILIEFINDGGSFLGVQIDGDGQAGKQAELTYEDGEFCFSFGEPIKKAESFIQLLAEEGGNLGAVNSDSSPKLVTLEHSTSYDMFDLISDSFGFSWRLATFEEAQGKICFALLLVTPNAWGIYGHDYFTFTGGSFGSLIQGVNSVKIDTPTFEVKGSSSGAGTQAAIGESAKEAAQAAISTSKTSMIAQFALNFVLVNSFGQMQSYIEALQVSIFPLLLFSLKMEPDLEAMIVEIYRLAALDFVPEAYLNELYDKVMTFSSDNEPPAKYQLLGYDSRNLFRICGSLVLYILSGVAGIVFCEGFLRFFVLKLMFSKEKVDQAAADLKANREPPGFSPVHLALRLYRNLNSMLVWGCFLGFFEAGQLDLFMACVLSIYNPYLPQLQASGESGEMIGLVSSWIIIYILSGLPCLYLGVILALSYYNLSKIRVLSKIWNAADQVYEGGEGEGSSQLGESLGIYTCDEKVKKHPQKPEASADGSSSIGFEYDSDALDLTPRPGSAERRKIVQTYDKAEMQEYEKASSNLDWIKAKFGFVVDDLSTRRISQMSLKLFKQSRRLLLLFVMSAPETGYMHFIPLAQVAAYLVASLIILIYFVVVKPYENPTLSFLEICNEGFVYLLGVFMLMMTQEEGKNDGLFMSGDQTKMASLFLRLAVILTLAMNAIWMSVSSLLQVFAALKKKLNPRPTPEHAAAFSWKESQEKLALTRLKISRLRKKKRKAEIDFQQSLASSSRIRRLLYKQSVYAPNTGARRLVLRSDSWEEKKIKRFSLDPGRPGQEEPYMINFYALHDNRTPWGDLRFEFRQLYELYAEGKIVVKQNPTRFEWHPSFLAELEAKEAREAIGVKVKSKGLGIIEEERSAPRIR